MIEYHLKGVSEPPEPLTDIDKWFNTVCESESRVAQEINIIFCSDEELLRINQESLNHDYFTDIITFDYCIDNQVFGDLFISVDRVKDNAETLKVSFVDELHRVMVHGLLHLCGYADDTPELKAQMRQKEDFYLSLRP